MNCIAICYIYMMPDDPPSHHPDHKRGADYLVRMCFSFFEDHKKLFA